MDVNIDDPGPRPREIGIRYDPIDAVTAAESVSQDKAIAAALSWIALPADLQASAHIETRLVLFTIENRYRQDWLREQVSGSRLSPTASINVRDGRDQGHRVQDLCPFLA
jgi:hypothetical protein